MPNRTQWNIAVLPGDGIGPEVMAVALRVLRALQETGGPTLEFVEYPWPSHAYHREHGTVVPGDWLDTLAGHDVILLGALGDPGPIEDSGRYRVSDSEAVAPLLKIRQHFDQWACERPAIAMEGAPRYLANPKAADIDMLVVRENSEGEYVGKGSREDVGTPAETATQIEVFTRTGAERIFHHAFQRARHRAQERLNGERRNREFAVGDGGVGHAQVCLITKRNALKFWGELYTEVFAEVAPHYPDVATHHELIDAACMKFVMCPWMFDVVVASNLQGDILTDLAAVLCGGLGVAPSCNINPSDRTKPPMFEPTHGSAPDIAGKNLADPRAMLLSAAMMLEWMGLEDPKAHEAGVRLRRAVAADLQAHGTGGRATTDIGDAIERAVRA